MKLVTFECLTPLGARRRTGALQSDCIVDLCLAREALLAARGHPVPAREAAVQTPAEMIALLELGSYGLDAARDAVEHALDDGVEEIGEARVRHPLDEVRLLAPLPRPNSLRDFMVVEEHVRGALRNVPEEWFNLPVYYRGNVDEIYGPDDLVPWPAYTDKLDYELEIAAVIGSTGRRIAADRAVEHIAGYTIYNDWSARDIQMREMSVGIGPGMGKDFGSSIGPCIATPDEFDRDRALLEARVDAETWSTGTLGHMHFSFEEIIAWISQEQTLHPGDLLGSGTVGRGCGLELDRWLTEGCTVELSAEGIGVLRNTVGHKGEGPGRLPALTTPLAEGGDE